MIALKLKQIELIAELETLHHTKTKNWFAKTQRILKEIKRIEKQLKFKE